MNSAQNSTIRKPFIEHVYELRRRLLWCCLAFFIGGSIGYALYDPLLKLVQQPIGQTLYFTSPTGGFNFVFKVCATFGLLVALPVIIYHLLKFVEPITKKGTRVTIISYLIWSINLAWAGILFGYFVSLPAALHFLTRFGGDSIQSLITADEYFSFALAYIVGFALLFQLPLLVLFINRINPLNPGGMMRAQRYVILVSFIVAAILTPTPDPLNQLIMALPVVLLYQFSIALIWLVNRNKSTNSALEVHSKPAKPELSINSAHSETSSTSYRQINPAPKRINMHRTPVRQSNVQFNNKPLNNPQFLDLRPPEARESSPKVQPTQNIKYRQTTSVLPRGGKPKLIDITA